MKFPARLVRRFHSVEKKTSEKQLLDDFGEFPPVPLRCERLTGKFKVVRTYGIGEIYQDLVLIKTLLDSVDSDPQSVSTDLSNFLSTEFVSDFRRSLDYLSRGSAFAKRVLISMALGHRFFRMTARAIRFGPERPNALGCFIPMLRCESQILIKAGRHRDRQKSDASTVSHEHIHLLQHRNSEDHSRHAKTPQDLLSEEGLSHPLLLYFLEKKEVEARLHELVLSFYRTHRRLPLTASGFLGLLASSRQLGELVTFVLKPIGVKVDEFGEYFERDVMFAEQLLDILLHIKTPHLRCRFITEVLAVMYGNLLKYYGDDMASRSYIENIGRPNLYDVLYSVETA